MMRFNDAGGGELLRQSKSGIEEFFDLTESLSRARIATLDPERLVRHAPEVLIATYCRFLYAQYLAKYAELTGSLIDSANRRAYLIFASSGRGLIELTAVLRYYTKRLQPYIDEAVRAGTVSPAEQQGIIEVLDKQARGGRFNWIEFRFGDRAEFAKRLVANRKKRAGSDDMYAKTNPESINVQTAIDQWSKESLGIALAYDYFCELVHPNLGSNFLVMGVANGHLTIGGASNKEIADGLCDEGILLLASTAVRDGARYLTVLSLLAEENNGGA